MRRAKKPLSPQQQAEALTKLQRDIEQRLKGYRERALRMFPPVCASCGRDFSGKRISELTVHHKDHNHDNNPPDGSNWELLCIYCHDHEHEKYKLAGQVAVEQRAASEPARIADPFAHLDALLKPKHSVASGK